MMPHKRAAWPRCRRRAQYDTAIVGIQRIGARTRDGVRGEAGAALQRRCRRRSETYCCFEHVARVVRPVDERAQRLEERVLAGGQRDLDLARHGAVVAETGGAGRSSGRQLPRHRLGS